MCKYCERNAGESGFGWNQPKLPYHRLEPMMELSGNVLENEKWDGIILDYQSAPPQLHLICAGYFGGKGIGTISIPIKYCPECGRKLGGKKSWRYMPELYENK